MRTHTGIDGLDTILGGGVIPGSNVLIEGAPGTGKTMFGFQFLYRGIMEYQEPGIYLTFEEQPEQIYRDASNFGWDFRAQEKANRLRVVCTSPEVIRVNAARFLDPFVEEIGAKRIVVDSVTHFGRLGASPAEYRELLYRFISGLKMKRLTAFLIREKQESAYSGGSSEEFMTDALIRLSFDLSKWQSRCRYLEVLKSRGHPALSGKHMFRIGPGGVSVFPSPRVPEEIIKGEFPGRIGTGILGLDEMIGGGLIEGSSTVVVGGPGSGRTTFCLQFLGEGVRRKEPGLFVSFHEKLHKIYATAHSYGMLDDLSAGELFEAKYYSPIGLDVNEFFSRIESAIRQKGIRRLAIDSLTNLEYAIPSPALVGEYLYNLLGLFEMHRVTSLLTYGIGGSVGGQGPEYLRLPMVIDNAILLEHRIAGGRNKRFISVVKMRMTAHEEEPREFVITGRGISLCQTRQT